MSKLALFGGEKTVTYNGTEMFDWPIITDEDREAILDCLNKRAMSGTDITKAFEKDWAKEYGYSFEVCYWRKCWNIRGAIIDILEMDINNDAE